MNRSRYTSLKEDMPVCKCHEISANDIAMDVMNALANATTTQSNCTDIESSRKQSTFASGICKKCNLPRPDVLLKTQKLERCGKLNIAKIESAVNFPITDLKAIVVADTNEDIQDLLHKVVAELCGETAENVLPSNTDTKHSKCQSCGLIMSQKSDKEQYVRESDDLEEFEHLEESDNVDETGAYYEDLPGCSRGHSIKQVSFEIFRLLVLNLL